jgi:hypothetical protein
LSSRETLFLKIFLKISFVDIFLIVKKLKTGGEQKVITESGVNANIKHGYLVECIRG